MPTSSKTSPVRFRRSSARPARRTGSAKPRRSKRTPRVVEKRRAADWVFSGIQSRRQTERLPGWQDLASRNERSASRPQAASFLERVSTLRFGLVLFAAAALCTMYVGHVHATQEVLNELERARTANQQLHLKHNRLKGAFDQATSPAVIYRRARQLGLVDGAAPGPTLVAE